MLHQRIAATIGFVLRSVGHGTKTTYGAVSGAVSLQVGGYAMSTCCQRHAAAAMCAR